MRKINLLIEMELSPTDELPEEWGDDSIYYLLAEVRKLIEGDWLGVKVERATASEVIE